MDQWYIPITIFPAAGLIIISTVNLYNRQSEELDHIIHTKEHDDSTLIKMKLSQLMKLGRALIGLYLSAGAFVLAGILGGIGIDPVIRTSTTIVGVFCIFFSLIILINYAVNSVSIKKYQFSQRTHFSNE